MRTGINAFRGTLWVLTWLAGMAYAGAQDLQLSVYATTGSVHTLATNEESRTRALELLSNLRVNKVYLETYRGGDVVPLQQLVFLRDFFSQHGFEVVGGIATVPGGNVGVAADRGLTWFNFQNPKTREDLARIIRTAAPLFDTFIVDDFLCTSDESVESNRARGARSWPDYRRDLMVSIAKDTIIRPAREANPSISVIIKFPQWYDLFQRYGYDVERMPQLFDHVWVGVETRGARTQRFGFQQPYQAFVNYRWMSENAPRNIGAAWFDHGDCGPGEFIDQAWEAALAGAPELVFFCYADVEKGHPDHARVPQEYDRLNSLFHAVRQTPAGGIPAYKPKHSDGHPYLMDFIGMLGVPLVPVSAFPVHATRVFLPEQAAADLDIGRKLADASSLETLVMTTGFLSSIQDQGALARQAGLQPLANALPVETRTILLDGQPTELATPLRLYANVTADKANARLQALVDGKPTPFLTEYSTGDRHYVVLNTYSYTEADFKAAHEWLLSPCPLGLIDLPQPWVDMLRTALSGARTAHYPDGAQLSAPARICFQPVGTGWFLQNYNETEVTAALKLTTPAALRDGFTGERLTPPASTHTFTLMPHARLWLRP